MEALEKATVLAPTFIFGVPRSGTTLLVQLLGSHPKIAPLYETRFLRNLVRFCDRASWLSRDSLLALVEKCFGTQFLERRFQRECETVTKKAIAYHRDAPPMCIGYTAQDLGRGIDAWLRSVHGRSFSRESIFRSAREFVDDLFAIHCQRMNKAHWINKTPGLLNHLDGLSRLYPDARYIHIFRDGRDVAVSNMGQKWGPNSVHQAAGRWKALL